MSRTLPAILTSLLYCLGIPSAWACDNATDQVKLFSLESKALLDNAPTFRHGWEDGNIQLKFKDHRTQAEGCQATMQLTLPQTDLDEVNAYLDQHPAKRILLGAQGYAIPENRIVAVDYRYQVKGDAVIPSNADNKPLKDLHHSIEFMYQLLAQTRADITPASRNTQPWSAERKAQQAQRCAETLKAETAPIVSACDCRIEKLEQQVSMRQLELVDFLLEQPYSTATGALIGYTEQSKAINHGCGLSKR
jgi:hypothetical protein